MIKELIRTNEFDKFIVVPSGTPAQKSAVASAEDRFEMTKSAVAQAIGTNARIEVADYEIKRPGLSFAVDTANEVSRKYPDHEIYWVIGSDALTSIISWHKFSDLAKIVKFLIIERPGSAVSEFPKELNYELRKIGAMDISASEIRERIADGEDISETVPTSVLDYIKRNGLYGTS